MEIFSSERPRTPPRSSEQGVERSLSSAEESSLKPEGNPRYFGHVTDLIYPIRDAESATGWHIPSTYRETEAVDSSLLLGKGASFSASLQRIPKAAERTEEFTDLGTDAVNKSRPSAQRPKYVVYKTTRVAFADDGQPLPEFRGAMRSVLTEFHALIYPSLRMNPNVIDFLGFAWRSSPFSSSHKLPAIIVEYAEHGTLANVVKNPNLSSTQRQFLALDVAQGLSALHQAGLTHGDIKADNVLVCSHLDRQYFAKIADFGFSIVQEAEDVQIYLGGTRPWMAPEVLKGPVLIQDLSRTDTFSLGLLCWVIFLDGGSPVDCLDDGGSGSKTVRFEAMKAAGSLLDAALDVEKWLEAFAHAKYDQRIERALDAQIARCKDMPAKSSLDAQQMQKNRPLLRTKMFDQMRLTFTKSSFLPHLLKVFQNSLKHEPHERDLRAVIAHLKVNLPSFEE